MPAEFGMESLSTKFEDVGILCRIFHFYVLLSLSDFNTLDCTVFCDMLVALIALCHLFEINKKNKMLLQPNTDNHKVIDQERNGRFMSVLARRHMLIADFRTYFTYLFSFNCFCYLIIFRNYIFFTF